MWTAATPAGRCGGRAAERLPPAERGSECCPGCYPPAAAAAAVGPEPVPLRPPRDPPPSDEHPLQWLLPRQPTLQPVTPLHPAQKSNLTHELRIVTEKTFFLPLNTYLNN